MSNLLVEGHAIDPVALEQAASWLVLQREGPLNQSRQSEFEAWLQRSDENERAWSRAQRLMARVESLPASLARRALDRSARSSRRGVLRNMLLLAGGISLGLMPRHFPGRRPGDHADYVTRPGEQREVMLTDGTRVLLNTDSALNVDYSDQSRVLRLLHGEIYISSGNDGRVPPRPLLVQVQQGMLQALGTRFSVRQLERQVLLAVYDGAVKVRVGDASAASNASIIGAGQQVRFDSQGIGPRARVNEAAPAWQIGLLVADDMLLPQWAQELMRYGRQTIIHEPALSGLRVSGSFPVRDTGMAIGMLAQTHGLQVRAVGDTVFITR